jgi:hypothetical protein
MNFGMENFKAAAPQEVAPEDTQEAEQEVTTEAVQEVAEGVAPEATPEAGQESLLNHRGWVESLMERSKGIRRVAIIALLAMAAAPQDAQAGSERHIGSLDLDNPATQQVAGGAPQRNNLDLKMFKSASGGTDMFDKTNENFKSGGGTFKSPTQTVNDMFNTPFNTGR